MTPQPFRSELMRASMYFRLRGLAYAEQIVLRFLRAYPVEDAQ